MSLRLRPLRGDDEGAFVEAHRLLAAEGFTFALGYEDEMAWGDYLDLVAREQRGEDLPEGRVAATILVAEVDGALVGRASIRHELNEFLAHQGGHIGYAVLPAHRRRGHATEILRQSLVIARALGIDRVLVTCDDDNLASATVIERCGGTFDGHVDSVLDGTRMRRYWID